jgi:hypothetical protein
MVAGQIGTLGRKPWGASKRNQVAPVLSSGDLWPDLTNHR